MSPLAKKLLMKPGQTWLILNAAPGYLALLEPLPDGVHLVFAVGTLIDGMQLFIKTAAELGDTLGQLASWLKPETVLWVI